MYKTNAQKKIKREHFDCIASTNDYAKSKRVEGQDLIVTASRQTGGRGTKGRSFSSDVGGAYLTKLTFYEDFPAARAFEIMASAAVAVCKTLEFYGLKPVIKWANDVFVNDKKISGILIENTFSGNLVSSSTVGIGLNVVNPLPQELSEIATSMRLETGKLFSVDEVRERLIGELCASHTMEEYLARVGYMGREVTLLLGERQVWATLLFVDETGGLHAQTDGKEERFSAAEVSLRLE